MDASTRLQIRARAQSYAGRAAPGLPLNDDGSGNESSAESIARRKFQRTAEPSMTGLDAIEFRKPSLPASATRQPSTQTTAANGPIPPVHQRKRSTLRERPRVPSGPREYPSPRKNVDSAAPADSDGQTFRHRPQHRSFLPQNPAKPPEISRFSFGNHSSNDTDSPITPAEVGAFDFLPAVNFDDFQTSLANYEGTSSPLLSDFPTHNGGRVLPKEDDSTTRSGLGGGGSGNSATVGAGSFVSQTARRMQQRQELDQQNLARGQDFGHGLNATSNDNRNAGQSANSVLPAPQRKQAPVPTPPQFAGAYSTSEHAGFSKTKGPPLQPLSSAPDVLYAGGPSGAPQKLPRKSIGPGYVAPTNETPRRPSAPLIAQDNSAPAHQRGLVHARTLSTSNKLRRSTIQPSSSINGLDSRTPSMGSSAYPRQPRPRNQNNTQQEDKEIGQSSQAARPISKGNLRATTPSSSGNKRQSIASGRMSGLGARTISPTDARRLKRLSMMNTVPVPSMPASMKKLPPSADDLPLSLQGTKLQYPDLPRNFNPSPSLIPRKASHTPSSTRASPDFSLRQAVNVGSRGSGVSLSSKSSYSSLPATTGANSKLPTSKARALHSAASANFGGESVGDDEIVPPVPAIPKAYGSPKEHELSFLSDSKSQSNLNSSLQPRKGSASSGSKAVLPEDHTWNSTSMPAAIDASSFPTSLLGFDDGFGEWKNSPKSSPSMGQQPTAEVVLRPRKTSISHKSNPTSGNTKKTTGDDPNTNHSNASAHTAEPMGTTGTMPKDYDFDPAGRKNANLQPLRLPALNLRTGGLSGTNEATFPIDSTNSAINALGSQTRTPEPKRVPKTPSTPMTASKATFFKRSHTDNPGFTRSSSSHFALRDILSNTMGDDATKWFDESDLENGNDANEDTTASIEYQQMHQRGITPFSSGSLPKGSGEFVRNDMQRQRPHDEVGDEFSLGRFDKIQLQSANPRGLQTNIPAKQSAGSDASSPIISGNETVNKEAKKESSGSGLRRKLSLSWRRSSSKAASHAENQDEGRAQNLKEKRSKDIMPPPKLPASATWTGDAPKLPSNTRLSLDQTSSSRRKSSAGGLLSLGLIGNNDVPPQGTPRKANVPPPDQSQTLPSTNRSTSWGPHSLQNGRQHVMSQPKMRQDASRPSISALKKDKDDMAADDEMRRLSQKRRDVDAAARESEALWQRAVMRSPMSPGQVLVSSSAGLNIYERGEVVDYQKDGVYFTGLKTAKKVIGSLSTTASSSDKSSDRTNNFGYDDERGDYNIVLGDHLAYRYEVVDVLGKGSFGQVVRCVDHKEGGVVAVKIIRNKKRFHQQALVEVGILTKLRDWDPNGDHATLSITSSFYFRNHLCIVTPCLGMNLYELIRAHNFTGFSLPLIRRFARQMLACLTLLQERRIIHCDLKPENILICDPRRADVRVIDFGSSCKEEEKVYTYIQSRFYRSPEVILGSNYGLGIDMWSFGCILAELWTGYPIFPGENEQEQLACIMEIFGPPDKKITDACTRKKVFFDSLGKPRVTVSSKGRRRRPSSKTLQQSMKTDDESFLDFIAKCLRWDPDRRMKPNEAVTHPFITNTSMKQLRQGIPDEARRAARLRPTAAVPTQAATTHNGPSLPSPVKRPHRVATDTGTASSQLLQHTPVKQKRDMSDASHTVGRGLTLQESHISQQQQQQPSPQKPTVASTNRRLSTLASAGGASAMAGSKRASNGATLGMLGLGNTAGIAPGHNQRQVSGRGHADLAQLAAAQSMNAVNTASKWRS